MSEGKKTYKNEIITRLVQIVLAINFNPLTMNIKTYLRERKQAF